MITALLMLNVPPQKKTEALNILQSVSEAMILKRDSVSARVYQTCADDNTILYFEEWKSKEALYQHIKSELYRRVLTVMELPTEEPTIKFSNFEEGLELIQSLRETR